MCTNTGCTHLSKRISSTRSCPRPRSLLERSPPGNRSSWEGHIRKDPTAHAAVYYYRFTVNILICGCKRISHPAINFPLPPSTVAFFGENLDSVPFLQWQLWAVTCREVISGSGDGKTLGAASCRTSLTWMRNGWRPDRWRFYQPNLILPLSFHDATRRTCWVFRS